MTILSTVSAAVATPTLPEPTTHPDSTPAGDALGAHGGVPDGGGHGIGAALALLGNAHELHPLARQAYAKQAGGAQGAETKVKHERVPGAETRVYDVRSTSQEDIDALKNSPDKRQQRLGHTIENVKASYGDLLDSKQVNIKEIGRAHV